MDRYFLITVVIALILLFGTLGVTDVISNIINQNTRIIMCEKVGGILVNDASSNMKTVCINKNNIINLENN